MYGKGAALSDDGKYRPRLWRIHDDDKHPALFIMLNPSTADGMADDPTIRRCVSFARSWGSGGILVANLFSYRTSSPDVLAEAYERGEDIVGPDADTALADMLRVTDVVVCAWGVGNDRLRVPMRKRLSEMRALVGSTSREVTCLGLTKERWPRHPLYLSARTPRVPFSI